MPSETSLNDEDKQLLIGFSKGLGVTDLSGQTSNCELYGKLFEERLADIFEFDEDENIDIMSVSIWYSLRNDEKYYEANNPTYPSFIKEIHDNLL